MFKILYKKPNISSFKAIKEFQKENNIRKIGHTGTLDPVAQGLLLVATDDDTKLIPYIKNKDKEYKVEMKLGFISKTYDAEGPIEFFPHYQPSNEEVLNILNSFIGNIQQIPPCFSAKKINGIRSYDLARQNKSIDLKPINVQIYNIDDIEYKYPIIKFTTKVSNGTYIRTLVNDIGQKLNTGAYMTFLERTKVHNLSINDSIDVAKLTELPIIKISDLNIIKNLFYGLNHDFDLNNNSYLLEYKNKIIGIIDIQNKNITSRKLFGNTIKEILKGN